jgi:iron complex transport system substrate-binding protein
MNPAPQRIVCLSAESADWLWRIGAWEKVAGVTAYFTPPPGAGPKPRVSGFSSANMEQIVRLNPDLVITYSDVQAALAATLVQQGLTVLATNQRTLAETETTLVLLARIVNREIMAEKVLAEFRRRLASVPHPARRPRVYFEEWNNPLVAGIGWVGELVERAGGEDVFSGLRSGRGVSQRVVTPGQVVQADPEIIFASWCGKPLDAPAMAARPGWEKISAVRNQQIHELPGEDILQPGFRLVQGFERMKQIIQSVS